MVHNAAHKVLTFTRMFAYVKLMIKAKWPSLMKNKVKFEHTCLKSIRLASLMTRPVCRIL